MIFHTLTQQYLKIRLFLEQRTKAYNKEFSREGFRCLFLQKKYVHSSVRLRSDTFIEDRTPIAFAATEFKKYSYTGFGEDIVYVIQESSGKIVSRRTAISFFEKMQKFKHGSLKNIADERRNLSGSRDVVPILDGDFVTLQY